MSEQSPGSLTRRHCRFGWVAVASFMALGLFLEALHGFKTPWYVEEEFETRRLLLTLAHAHGTLFGVLNILFGLTVGRGVCGRSPELASRLLLAGTVLLPGGFLLGGIYVYGGDPGVGAALAPIGAAAALIAVVLAALSPGRAAVETPDGTEKPAQPQRRKRNR